jgi:crotonobetainyl-CoA:carnitine CoA-transferase CaiB-like acyl-CoA transferase
MSLPLEGTRVLDCSRLLPGNYCTLLLADLGADVVKIEEPGRGDYIRWTVPLVEGESAVHRALNRGKRSATVDLKSDQGVEVFRRLAAGADAVIESFRPGVMDRLGVGYESLRSGNERLVYCAITGYGQDGPYRDRVGHDINYIGHAGLLHATGQHGGPPILPAVQVGDFGGGMAAALGTLAALTEAASTGHGRFVDVSMLDVATSWLGVVMSWYLATGEVPPRGGMPLSGGLACYRVYRAGDGKYLSVGALEPQFWQALCEALDLPDLVDQHFAPADAQEAVATKLQAVFETRPRDEWVERLAHLETCVGPVNDVSEALDDPQVVHRGLVARVAGTPVGPGPAVGLPGEARVFRPAPGLGEHTDEVLLESGVSSGEISDLRSIGAI